MTPPEDLERLLSEAEPLDDNGFTDRVMARLPETRARAGARRDLVLGLSALAAVVAAAIVPGAEGAVAAVHELLAPLLALPFDPARASVSLTSAETSRLVLHAAVLAVIGWGTVTLARGDAG